MTLPTTVSLTWAHHSESSHATPRGEHHTEQSAKWLPQEPLCETQLLKFLDELTTHVEMEQIDTVVMDFAKAFNKVDHSLLLHKLHHYGIRDTLNQWICSFLTNWKQAVVVDGVPQGSVIRPVFFLIYINHLAARVSSMTCLFADGMILYRFITASEDHDTLQADLQRTEEWEEG